MPRRIIDKIREKIRLLQYDMTLHAMEEMAEDNLDILDIEHAILGGHISRVEKGDPRGTKYVIEGFAVPCCDSRSLYKRTLPNNYSL